MRGISAMSGSDRLSQSRNLSNEFVFLSLGQDNCTSSLINSPLTHAIAAGVVAIASSFTSVPFDPVLNKLIGFIITNYRSFILSQQPQST